MAEFVRAQIFGTTFEITSRYSRPLFSIGTAPADEALGTPTCNRWAWELLAWSGMDFPAHSPLDAR